MAVPQVLRKPYEVEIEGQKYYVRALTPREQKTAIESVAKSDNEFTFTYLLYGWCDSEGRSLLEDCEKDREDILDRPSDVLIALVQAISERLKVSKKG